MQNTALVGKGLHTDMRWDKLSPTLRYIMRFILQNVACVFQASILVGCSKCCGNLVKDIWGSKLGGAIWLLFIATHKKNLVSFCVSQEREIQGASRETDVMLRNIHFKNIRFAWRTLYFPSLSKFQFLEHKCLSSLPRPEQIWGPHIFGALAKLRKATISFVLSVRPSLRMELLRPHSTD